MEFADWQVAHDGVRIVPSALVGDSDSVVVDLPHPYVANGVSYGQAVVCTDGVVHLLNPEDSNAWRRTAFALPPSLASTFLSLKNLSIACCCDDPYFKFVDWGSWADCGSVSLPTGPASVIEVFGLGFGRDRTSADPPLLSFQLVLPSGEPNVFYLTYLPVRPPDCFASRNPTIGVQCPMLRPLLPGEACYNLTWKPSAGMFSEMTRLKFTIGCDTDPLSPDTDADGFTDQDEIALFGTDPFQPDTDGDGASDFAEVSQSSDPNDASDGGVPGSRVSVMFYFGDHSWSHSEKYTLSVTPVSGPGARPSSFVWRNERFGECETKTAFLMPGWRYEVRLDHSGTKPGLPTDYDYTLRQTGTLPSNVIITDDQSLFGVDETSTSFTGGGTGRTVQFTPSGGEGTTVQVDVGDCPGPAPQLTVRMTTPHEVLIFPCVIETAEEASPITASTLTAWLNEVNVIYRQVGLHFSLGAPITNIVNNTWAQNGLVNTAVGAQIRNILANTGGIEVYFIPGNGSDLENPGAHTSYGIIVRSSANARTLAHEIGHACGWADIYIREGFNGPIPAELNSRVRRDWLPDDWSGGGDVGGFYETYLLQCELIPRLLMYGEKSDVKADIPAGAVYGLSKVGGLGNINVGRYGFFTSSPRSL